jgi:YcaO-like protein with predicted kinase domain
MTTPLWRRVGSDTAEPRYHFGTSRAAAPRDTLRRIAPLLAPAGITRLADVTGLDWIGLPVYQAIRPNSRNISVSQGKGLTRTQAKVSALMESLESFHAEEIAQPAMRATLGDARRHLAYDPYTLPVTAAATDRLPIDLDHDPYAPGLGFPSWLSNETPLDWIEATDLSTGKATWLPRQLCELNFCVEERLWPPLFRATSNGLASGNTTAEAVVHGLCEVIERDSLWRIREVDLDADREVDLSTVRPALARRLLERFASVGMHTRLIDATGPSGVPCFVAYLFHPESPGRYYGAGCHPSRATAVVRALTEAAQSRLGHIAGSRDDLFRRSYLGGFEWRNKPGPQRQLVAPRDYVGVPNVSITTWAEMVHDLVRRIGSLTGAAPLAVDLGRPEFGLPVCLVVAPGLRLIAPSRR